MRSNVGMISNNNCFMRNEFIRRNLMQISGLLGRGRGREREEMLADGKREAVEGVVCGEMAGGSIILRVPVVRANE